MEYIKVCVSFGIFLYVEVSEFRFCLEGPNVKRQNELYVFVFLTIQIHISCFLILAFSFSDRLNPFWIADSVCESSGLSCNSEKLSLFSFCSPALTTGTIAIAASNNASRATLQLRRFILFSTPFAYATLERHGKTFMGGEDNNLMPSGRMRAIWLLR